MELPVGERVAKATEYLTKGVSGFARATQADEEFQVRARASEACEDVFHALVALSDALLAYHGRTPVQGHTKRVQALRNIGRDDLADLYHIARDALHTDGYYNQEMEREQKRVIERVQEVIAREAEKLARPPPA